MLKPTEVSAYAYERERAIRLLNTIPDDRLLYVIGFLERASTPENRDPFYSADNLERLQRSIEQMETTDGTIHEVDFDEEIMD